MTRFALESPTGVLTNRPEPTGRGDSHVTRPPPQDYRDALAAEDAILDEMAVRQGLADWTPAEHPPLPALSADPATH